jgi:aspartyl-tRNA(Asn)/glutamyl-tRNA(Gln) amidotransferase subunit A
MVNLDGHSLLSALRSRELSARQACEESLSRIAADLLGCIWATDGERALAAADRLDEQPPEERGDSAWLAGVPVGVKDAFDVAGLPTSGGVAGTDQPASADAAAVALLRRAGALVVAKTAMHQLGWGMSGQSPGFQRCLNPRAPDRMPGGSSSGSAAAVAAGLVPVALGADTAGSVRVPAAWCGVVGVIPSPQLLPLAGCLPLVPALDRVGVLGLSVETCALTLGALGVFDRQRLQPIGRPLRVGLLAEMFESEHRIEGACRDALAAWRESGAELEEVNLDWDGRGLGKVYAFELAERWGPSVDAHPDRFDEGVLSGVEFGRTIDAEGYRSVLAQLASHEQAAAARAAAFDVLVCPTVPIDAPAIESPDPVAIASRNTRLFNALGFAALSLPCPVGDGLPVGLQLAAPRGSDRVLLEAALALEEVLR